jgi:hypothetical protein
VTGGCEQAASDWVEAARGRCDVQALEGLWAAVPESMRLRCFAESSVPPQYVGAFCHDGTWRAGVDLAGLPEPMRREVAWCMFRIIELGGKIPTPTLSMLVHRLGEVITDRAGQARACHYNCGAPRGAVGSNGGGSPSLPGCRSGRVKLAAAWSGGRRGIVKLTLIMIFFAEANTQCQPVRRT